MMAVIAGYTLASWKIFLKSEAQVPQEACLVMAASLAVRVRLRVNYAHMPCQSIIARESLLFAAMRASDLHFAVVVDGVLVPCQIVRAREDSVAGLAR
jgi:hypothetical protein